MMPDGYQKGITGKFQWKESQGILQNESAVGICPTIRGGQIPLNNVPSTYTLRIL
jgi:hypothetical protein